MRSSTSLKGSGLVRSVGPCAQLQGGHINARILEREALSAARSVGPLSRSPSLERSERRGGLLFVVPVDSPVDSTFERSENFTIAHTVSSRSCYSAIGLQ